MDRTIIINRLIGVICITLILLFGPWLFGQWSVVFLVILSFLLIVSKLPIWETLFGTLGLLLLFGFLFWGWEIGVLKDTALSWFGGLSSIVWWFITTAIIALLVGLLTKDATIVIVVVVIWSLVYFFAWGGDIPWFGGGSINNAPSSPAPSEDDIWFGYF